MNVVCSEEIRALIRATEGDGDHAEADSSEEMTAVRIEAAKRFAQVMDGMPADLAPYVHHENELLESGQIEPKDAAILLEDQMRFLLYGDPKKKDARFVIAWIRYRAQQAQKNVEDRLKAIQESSKTVRPSGK